MSYIVSYEIEYSWCVDSIWIGLHIIVHRYNTNNKTCFQTPTKSIQSVLLHDFK